MTREEIRQEIIRVLFNIRENRGSDAVWAVEECMKYFIDKQNIPLGRIQLVIEQREGFETVAEDYHCPIEQDAIKIKTSLYEAKLDADEKQMPQTIITVANHQQVAQLSDDISAEIKTKDNELTPEARFFADHAKQGINLIKENAGKVSILVIKSIRKAFENLLKICLAMPGFEILCEMITASLQFLSTAGF